MDLNENHEFLSDVFDLEEFGWETSVVDKDVDDRCSKLSDTPVGSPVTSDSSPTSPIIAQDCTILNPGIEDENTDLNWISEVLQLPETDLIQAGTVSDSFIDTVAFTDGSSLLVKPDVSEFTDCSKGTETDLGPEGVIADQELISLSVRDLNRRLHSLPEDVRKSLKRRRRTLKNRGYARNCRSKRMRHHSEVELQALSLQDQVAALQKQVEDRDSELERVNQEKDLYKQRYEQIISLLTKKAE